LTNRWMIVRKDLSIHLSQGPLYLRSIELHDCTTFVQVVFFVNIVRIPSLLILMATT
jgi:hypothetical protein